MRYLNTVLAVLFLLAIITFCVNNTQEFTLAFLGYRLTASLQLWALMVAFFVMGMVPVVAVEIPVRSARYLRRRAVKDEIRNMEQAIARSESSAPDPGKEVPEQP